MATVNYTVFDGEIVEEDRGGTLRDYVPDPLGSTRALLDNSQTITDSWSYWPYGEVNQHSGSTDTRFTYIGSKGYYLETMGSFYVRARHYQLNVGRWLSQDPKWPRQLAYTYCRANPSTWSDPSGLGWWWVAGVAVVATGIGIYSLHHANSGCCEPSQSSRDLFEQCNKKIRGCGFDAVLSFQPTLICNDLVEKSGALADTNGLFGGCRFRVDKEDYLKATENTRCVTLLHEMLHCTCRAFYTDDDPRHDTLDEWADILFRNCQKGVKTNDTLWGICKRINDGISPER